MISVPTRRAVYLGALLILPLAGHAQHSAEPAIPPSAAEPVVVEGAGVTAPPIQLAQAIGIRRPPQPDEEDEEAPAADDDTVADAETDPTETTEGTGITRTHIWIGAGVAGLLAIIAGSGGGGGGGGGVTPPPSH